MNADITARAAALRRYERMLYDRGYSTVAGMDEAGRGPLAGPVVAACVVMPIAPLLEGVDDSKRISEGKREKLFEEILRAALGYGFGVADHLEVDGLNIRNATLLAFARAYANMTLPCDYLLIDGLDVIPARCAAEAVVGGDGACYSVAAASVLAKVYRDRLMREYDGRYPEYGFARHKGYGTKKHMDALKQYGPCDIHRRTFIRHLPQGGGHAQP